MSALDTLRRRVRAPEVLERDRELEAELGIVLGAPVERGSEVVPLREREHPAGTATSSSSERCADEGNLEHPLGVAAADVGCLARGVELLDREFADRLEHPEALLAEAARPSPHEALVEKRRERVEIGVADCLGRLERAAPAKDRESPEELLLVLVEEIVRPGDRRSQSRVALVGVACPLQEVESLRRVARAARPGRGASSARRRARRQAGDGRGVRRAR